MDNIVSRIDRVIRSALPVISCVLLIFMAQAPWFSPLIHALFDALALMLLCYWVIYRPDLFSAPWSFVLGLLHDALVGQFLGVGALGYLLADFILRAQRTFFLNLSFLNGWMVYAIVFTGALLLQWGLTSLFTGVFVDFLPVILRLVLGILLFPLVAGILNQFQPALRHV